jgi:hypothetical protein
MNYIVVLFKNKVRQRIIKKFVTSKKANDFFINLINKNQNVIFDTQTENGKSVKYEIALLEKKGDTLFPIYTKDEFGRNIKLEFEDEDYNIVKISSYKEPELIQDYQTKNKISVETFINKYLSKDGLKMISKLNNKLLVQKDEEVFLFVLKNEFDCVRLIDSMIERFVKLKRGDCMFVNDTSPQQKKYLYKFLIEKGFDKKFLYRKETTYSSDSLFKM